MSLKNKKLKMSKKKVNMIKNQIVDYFSYFIFPYFTSR